MRENIHVLILLSGDDGTEHGSDGLTLNALVLHVRFTVPFESRCVDADGCSVAVTYRRVGY